MLLNFSKSVPVELFAFSKNMVYIPNRYADFLQLARIFHGFSMEKQ
jgi:hypothetical protein